MNSPRCCGIDRTWCHGVDRDAVRRQLNGQLSGEPDDRGFGGSVGNPSGVGPIAVEIGDDNGESAESRRAIASPMAAAPPVMMATPVAGLRLSIRQAVCSTSTCGKLGRWVLGWSR
jgi:hypothetical protein